MTKCRNCGKNAGLAFRKLVLRRYDAGFYRCESCGFLQTEEPYWLDEAYGNDPVSPYDVGSPYRAISCARLVTQLITDRFDPRGSFLDYGGGTGLFVRLMRDRGFQFYRHDPHCPNIYARFFDWNDCKADGERADLVTCFEVFEHFVEPRKEFSRLAQMSDTILLTTCLQPPPAELPCWQYLIPECGQHVAFHTQKSLESLGAEFGYHLATDGRASHLFYKWPIGFDVMPYLSPPSVPMTLSGRIVRKVSKKLMPWMFDPPQWFPYPPAADAEWVEAEMARRPFIDCKTAPLTNPQE